MRAWKRTFRDRYIRTEFISIKSRASIVPRHVRSWSHLARAEKQASGASPRNNIPDEIRKAKPKKKGKAKAKAKAKAAPVPDDDDNDRSDDGNDDGDDDDDDAEFID